MLTKFTNFIKQKLKNNTFFAKTFGFESGIDITDDNQLLYRKNVVIKNIIFVSNIIYTLIFALISFGDESNWLLTLLLFPVTFFVNATLKKMINKGYKDKMSQIIAMYYASFYMFLSTIVIYFKLKAGSQVYLQECGYILLYYSLTICAFYQDKKMLKNIFLWVFIIVTILHFTVTHDILFDESNKNIMHFIETFFTSSAFKDILIRSILLGLFMLVLYIYVSMANYMQTQRINELMKRREVQEDFNNVVTKIFESTLSSEIYNVDDIQNIKIISIMTKKLASLLSIDPASIDKLVEFSKVHIEKKVNLGNDVNIDDDVMFDELRNQTKLGSEIISRYQLSRKSENIIRAILEGNDTDDFKEKQREIQNNIESQIILICEIYVSMRSVKSYKKAYNHIKALQVMDSHTKIYFDPLVFDRFMKFNNDFEAIYDDL